MEELNSTWDIVHEIRNILNKTSVGGGVRAPSATSSAVNKGARERDQDERDCESARPPIGRLVDLTAPHTAAERKY